MESLNVFGELKGLVEILTVIEQLMTWRFRAITDERTCADCMELNGREFEVDSPSELDMFFPYGELVSPRRYKPNIHPNCRCIISHVHGE